MDQIQPSSVDLRLGPVAYRVEASFLPGLGSTTTQKLKELTIEEIDISTPALLERGRVYIVPIQEELRLPEFHRGRANPKSSTGRVDVFTRLITDYSDAFDEVREEYKGKLYAEIVPLTFPVLVREGVRLNQLRIRRVHGDPPLYDKWLRALHEREPLVYSDNAVPSEALIDAGLRLHLDLRGLGGSTVIGYRAKKDAPPIDLTKVSYYDPREFWHALCRNKSDSIVLEPGDFYILASKEKVSVPPDMAAEMSPFDPEAGEFRVHYAGFFDPGFGWRAQTPTGSHAVLEVRSHGVPSLIEHGQVVARLKFEYLLAPPLKLYGGAIGSSYQSQGLALSKHFKQYSGQLS